MVISRRAAAAAWPLMGGGQALTRGARSTGLFLAERADAARQCLSHAGEHDTYRPSRAIEAAAARGGGAIYRAISASWLPMMRDTGAYIGFD